MTKPMAAITLRTLAACAMLAGTTAALAHVTLPPGGATVGSDYNAAFRVGHACEGAKATTGLAVRLPKGFVLSDAQARKGWKLDVTKSGDGEVRWTAETPGASPDPSCLRRRRGLVTCRKECLVNGSP